MNFAFVRFDGQMIVGIRQHTQSHTTQPCGTRGFPTREHLLPPSFRKVLNRKTHQNNRGATIRPPAPASLRWFLFDESIGHVSPQPGPPRGEDESFSWKPATS